MKIWRQLWHLVDGEWRWIHLGMGLAFITLLANVGLMAVSGWFITAMASAGLAGVSMNYFTPAALIRLAAIVRTGGRYGERVVTHEATFRILARLRVWLYQRLETLSPATLATFHSGDLLSRLSADIDLLNQVYLRLWVPAVVAGLALLSFTFALCWFEPRLALLEGVALSSFGIMLPWLWQRCGQVTGARMVAQQAALRTQLISDLQGMNEWLVYGAQTQQAQRVQHLSEDLIQQQQTLQNWQALAQILLGLGSALTVWVMLWIAIPLVEQQRISPPQLTLLTLFTLASFEAVAPLPLALQSLGEILAAARRIFSLAEQLPTIPEPPQPLPIPQQWHWQIAQLSFHYPQQTQPALQAVNFDLAQGEKLALMGATGSGKSTVLQLLLRFYEPSAGSILLNGQPLSAYHSEALREHMAVVMQQPFLFNATIADNLRLAKPQATQAELEHVCHLALLHDFITQQPQGYATWVGETGVKLSGGQRKRLAIARALLKPATRLLMLDEPTEGLDAVTAERLMRNIVQHVTAQQQSLLLITHQTYGLAALDKRCVIFRNAPDSADC